LLGIKSFHYNHENYIISLIIDYEPNSFDDFDLDNQKFDMEMCYYKGCFEIDVLLHGVF